ncbi:hypothetical protein PsYK624_166350 [Phanerochaete sordida]|uniref:Uncharacterized protein n=1 Tax=Phanerochaete sordida TaxID=48140 RepID=A0A9P3GTF4_9APHY|nr:hypothetical protein PsYK624_166350 [Phanerochaete sordida]
MTPRDPGCAPRERSDWRDNAQRYSSSIQLSHDRTSSVLSSVHDTCLTALRRNPGLEECCALSDRPTSRKNSDATMVGDGWGGNSREERGSDSKARVYDEVIGQLLQSHDLHRAQGRQAAICDLCLRMRRQLMGRDCHAHATPTTSTPAIPLAHQPHARSPAHPHQPNGRAQLC